MQAENTAAKRKRKENKRIRKEDKKDKKIKNRKIKDRKTRMSVWAWKTLLEELPEI